MNHRKVLIFVMHLFTYDECCKFHMLSYSCYVLEICSSNQELNYKCGDWIVYSRIELKLFYHTSNSKLNCCTYVTFCISDNFLEERPAPYTEKENDFLNRLRALFKSSASTLSSGTTQRNVFHIKEGKKSKKNFFNILALPDFYFNSLNFLNASN